MVVKHYCPFCKKLISVEKIDFENRKVAKTIKENMKIITKVLGKNCESIHN